MVALNEGRSLLKKLELGGGFSGPRMDLTECAQFEVSIRVEARVKSNLNSS